MVHTSRRTAQKRGRKSFMKDLLLPLPIARVNALSLENHLALAAMRSGHGSVDVISNLIRVVYLAYFIGEVDRDRGGLELFRAAEAVLERSTTQAGSRNEWTVPEEDHAVLGQVVVMHDRQLASIPAHCYAEAWARLQQFMSSNMRSPIAVP